MTNELLLDDIELQEILKNKETQEAFDKEELLSALKKSLKQT